MCFVVNYALGRALASALFGVGGGQHAALLRSGIAGRGQGGASIRNTFRIK